MRGKETEGDIREKERVGRRGREQEAKRKVYMILLRLVLSLHVLTFIHTHHLLWFS